MEISLAVQHESQSSCGLWRKRTVDPVSSSSPICVPWPAGRQDTIAGCCCSCRLCVISHQNSLNPSPRRRREEKKTKKNTGDLCFALCLWFITVAGSARNTCGLEPSRYGEWRRILHDAITSWIKWISFFFFKFLSRYIPICILPPTSSSAPSVSTPFLILSPPFSFWFVPIIILFTDQRRLTLDTVIILVSRFADFHVSLWFDFLVQHPHTHTGSNHHGTVSPTLPGSSTRLRRYKCRLIYWFWR